MLGALGIAPNTKRMIHWLIGKIGLSQNKIGLATTKIGFDQRMHELDSYIIYKIGKVKSSLFTSYIDVNPVSRELLQTRTHYLSRRDNKTISKYIIRGYEPIAQSGVS